MAVWAERLRVAEAVVAAEGVLLDVVDLETLVEKAVATHAAPLLRRGNPDLLGLGQLATKAVSGDKRHPCLTGRSPGKDSANGLHLKVHLRTSTKHHQGQDSVVDALRPLLRRQARLVQKEGKGGHSHAAALYHCT